ncbi:MAG TPA: DJ-1/PfpI family protein [Holophagaceae bacterium]|nr:DJ-1/PfpI family protein [Holophagaceae bacterium]
MHLAFGLRALLLSFACFVAAAAQGAPKVYKCAPCDSVCDLATYDKPGMCPHCAMPLVTEPKKVAILVFNGVQIIDYTGPYEMFGAAGCEVFTVAATKDPVKTAMGMVVVPKYTFADAPKADVLVIPGGNVGQAQEDPGTLQFIKQSNAQNQATLSVCNGAFILASTGLLDGLTVTTTRGNIPRLAKRFAKLKVVGERRYVDNGHIVTAAGLSAGIDGALHVIEKLLGTETAKQVAFAEEYAWVPQP